MKHTFEENITPIAYRRAQKNQPYPRLASNQARTNRSESQRHVNKANRIMRRFGEIQKPVNQGSDFEVEDDFEEQHAICGPPAPVEFKSKPPSKYNIKMMQGYMPDRTGKGLGNK